MTATRDPFVFVEQQLPGYIRYWRSTDQARWEVHGTCLRLGDCMVGAVLADGTVVQDKNHLAQLNLTRSVELLTDMDTPITPTFRGCCSFTYTVLPVGAYQPALGF